MFLFDRSQVLEFFPWSWTHNELYFRTTFMQVIYGKQVQVFQFYYPLPFPIIWEVWVKVILARKAQETPTHSTHDKPLLIVREKTQSCLVKISNFVGALCFLDFLLSFNSSSSRTKFSNIFTLRISTIFYKSHTLSA